MSGHEFLRSSARKPGRPDRRLVSVQGLPCPCGGGVISGQATFGSPGRAGLRSAQPPGDLQARSRGSGPWGSGRGGRVSGGRHPGARRHGRGDGPAVPGPGRAVGPNGRHDGRAGSRGARRRGLTDAATIAVDASLGNDFRVTIAANRTMGNPANPVDGQKITFQVTQGAGGSSAITWGSSYEFSTGLPQPTLSTTAGQTDLLALHLQRGQGQVAACRVRERVQLDVVITQPKGTYRLFPSTNGPSSPVSYTGPFLAGVVFEVTTGGCWFDGYWWWVCPSGQSTVGAEVRAVGHVRQPRHGTLVPDSHGHLRHADRRAVELRAAGRRRCRWPSAPPTSPHRVHRQLPRHQQPVRLRRPLQRRDRQRPADRVLRPVRVTAGAVHTPRACSASPAPTRRRTCPTRVQCRQLLDGRPGRHQRRPAGHVLPAVAELPDAAGPHRLGHHGLHPGHRVPAVAVLHAGQHLVLLRVRRGSAADQVRDLERQLRRAVVSGTDNTSPSWSGRPGPAGCPALTAA